MTETERTMNGSTACRAEGPTLARRLRGLCAALALAPLLANATATPPAVPATVASNPLGGNQISVSWAASTGSAPATQYLLYRNGTQVAQVAAPTLSWTDPAVASGAVVAYTVAACDASANCSAQSLPSVSLNVAQSGPNFSSLNINTIRNAGVNNAGYNYYVNVQYPRGPGDGLASYSISCPGVQTSSGNFNAPPASNGSEWRGIGFGNSLSGLSFPMTCMSTVTLASGATNSANFPIDFFPDASALPANLSLGFNQNVNAVPTVSWSQQSGFAYNLGISVVPSNAFVWGQGPVSSPLAYSGPALVANTDYLVTLNASTAISGNYNHIANVQTLMCFQCSGNTTAPAIPTEIGAAQAGAAAVAIYPGPSAGSGNVAYLNVYRNGTLLGSTVNSPFVDNALAPVTLYHYTVAACNAQNVCSDPSLPVNVLTVQGGGPNFSSVTVLRTLQPGAVNGKPEGFQVGLNFPRFPGDGLTSYSLSCPGMNTASGSFSAPPSSGTRSDWQANFSNTLPATPMVCTSTVVASGVSNTVQFTVDYFLPSSAYATGTNISYYQGVSAVPNLTWTPVAGYLYSGNVSTTSYAGMLFSQKSVQAPPLTLGGSSLSANSAYMYGLNSSDSWGGNYNHQAQVWLPFCYQCAADAVAPSVPGTPSASAAGPTQVNLSWAASSDNIAVAYYQIFRGSTLVGQSYASNGTGFNDSSAAPGVSYSYTVKACDAQNNCSAASGAVTVVTPIAGVSFNVASVAFAATQQSQRSAVQTVVVSYNGTTPWNVSGVTSSGDFFVTANSCTGLSSSGTCRISLAFNPSALGPRTGTLTIASNAVNGPNTLSLSGTGTALLAPGSSSWTALAGSANDPAYGGVVRNFTLTPDGSYWAAIADAGLYRSQDGGNSWQAMNNGLSSRHATNFAFNTTPSVNATGNSLGSNLYEIFLTTSGGGVNKSVDGGNSWSASNTGLGCLYLNHITRVTAYSPTRLIVSAGCKTGSGVYYSTDGGANWVAATGLPDNVKVSSVVRIGPPSGTSLADFLLAMTDQGIYKSSDRGNSWALTDSGIANWGPNGHVAYHASAAYYSAAPATQVVLALIEGVGLVRSTDQGATWAQANSGLPAGAVPTSSITNDGSNWYVSIDGRGVYRSTDRGLSWSQFASQSALPNSRFVFFANDPNNGGVSTLFAATQSGPYKSLDSGTTWLKAGPGLPGGWTVAAAFNAAGDVVVGAAGGVFKYSTSSGAATRIGGSSLGIVNTFTGDGSTRLYAATANQGAYAYAAASDSWSAINSGLPTNLAAQAMLLRIDPSSSTGLYAGLYGAGFYFSSTGSGGWVARNNGLSGDALKIRNIQASGSTVLIATEAGLWRSPDNGQNWSRVLLPVTATGQSTFVDHLSIDSGAGSPFAAYAAVYNTDPLGNAYASSGVWKSLDGGVTWTQLSGLAGKKVHDVRAARASTLTLYAGVWNEDGTGGVYQSADGGVNWTALNTGLDSVSTNAFLVDGAGLLRGATTLGDGFYLYSQPLATAPATPTNLSVAGQPAGPNVSQVQLQWDNVGAPSYQVYRALGAGAFAYIGSTHNNVVVDQSLAPGTTYRYYVVAFNGTLSAASNTVSASTTSCTGTDCTAPSTPEGLNASLSGATQIYLNWGAANDNVAVTRYAVARSTAGGAFTTVASVPVGTEYVDSGLAAGTSYSYKVSACDAAGNCSLPSAPSLSVSTLPASTIASVLSGANALFGNLRDIVNAHPTDLDYTHLRPVFDANGLFGGRRSDDKAKQIAGSLRGATISAVNIDQLLRYDPVSGVAAVAGTVTVGGVVHSVGATGPDDDDLFTIKLQADNTTWLAYGNQQLVRASIEVRRLYKQLASGSSTAYALYAFVQAPQNPVTGGASTLSGGSVSGGLLSTSALTHNSTAAESVEGSPGVTTVFKSDRWTYGQENLSSAAAPGIPYTVTVQPLSGPASRFVINSNRSTSEAIQFTNLTGHSLAAAKPGGSLALNWTAPTSFAVAGYDVWFDLFTATSPNSSCEVQAFEGNPPSTNSAVVTVPMNSPCDGQPVTSLLLAVKAYGVNGETTAVYYDFAGGPAGVAEASLSTTALSFPPVTQGTTSTAQTVTITNSGTATLIVATISVNGPFGATNTCNVDLAPGASCSVSVSFSPSSAGSFAGTLVLTDNAGNSPQTITLSGTGQAASYTLTVNGSANGTVSSTPAGINCGAGCSATITSGNTVTLSATPNSGYSFTGWSGACSGTGNCVLTVSANTVVSASFAALSPGVSVSASTLNFGSQGVGTTSATQVLTLSNAGPGVATLGSVALSGSNAADFSVASNSCGATLAVSATCSVGISFRPSATGSRSASLAIPSNGSGGTLTVSLSGTGSGTQAPQISLIKGWNLVGNGSDATLTVANAFGNSAHVTTVWKWVTTGSTPGISYPAWAFYAPSLADGGQSYAASKGYDFLTVINAGEGFWVNSIDAFSVPLPSSNLLQSSSFMPAVASPATPGGSHALPHSWSLIAVGDSPTPNMFNTALSTMYTTPPTSGQTYTNLTTLWAWNATSSGWYFWAPALLNSGGLSGYIASKSYLDFLTLPTAPAGTLSPTMGFWVNMP